MHRGVHHTRLHRRDPRISGLIFKGGRGKGKMTVSQKQYREDMHGLHEKTNKIVENVAYIKGVVDTRLADVATSAEVRSAIIAHRAKCSLPSIGPSAKRRPVDWAKLAGAVTTAILALASAVYAVVDALGRQ